MKNQFANLLRGGVFLLALAVAFAFTAPAERTSEKYGFHNGHWYDATDAEIGTDYRCDNPTTQVCLRALPQPGATPVSTGVFVPITLSPM